MKRGRKLGEESAERRKLLLDTTQRLMLEEGYAAVTTRRVAKEAGLTSALVHYYYPTTDDLLLAVCRRAHEIHLERLAQALVSENVIRALWQLHRDPKATAFAAEVLALANHRKVISLEVAKNIEQSRRLQIAALSGFMGKAAPSAGFSAAALAMAMVGLCRAMVTETAHGVSLGHAELEAFVEGWSGQFGGKQTDTAGRTKKDSRLRGASSLR
jgi:AcrR family transcriptional regulator